ncbi:MAG: hypothetical protein RI884_609 [Pseudomonadota bacterium]|jgi:hypothetical protein
MRTPISNLLAAHRAVIESTQDIGLKGVEVATRFFELQTQAAQGMLASGGDAAHGGMPDAVAMARGSAEYTQRAVSLAWQTHAELTQLVNRQVGQLQTLFNELLTAAIHMQGSIRTHEAGLGGRRHAPAKAGTETA